MPDMAQLEAEQMIVGAYESGMNAAQRDVERALPSSVHALGGIYVRRSIIVSSL